jgi:hypothetical protein
VYVRQGLRKKEICGLAHVLAELTIKPDGSVGGYRIFAANTEQVYNALPEILNGLQFNSTGSKVDQYFMLEFKTDIECGDKPPMLDLNKIPNYIVTDQKSSVKNMDATNISRPTDK